ncbi:fumarylacetoacetate hydrolase [Nocardioides scoriae]|uniref:fumarylacetoacetase n=1 Tax=Nocardioides scoriae TaxID=642780 RepID=A0A1H1LG61_9ACTN|nr:fumarylacetoacetate hydrolase family protein [Nocardioides scoriae]SDR72849.1 fumarylacetoacetate hydrolase [Nocardioides scoriae]
MTCWVEGVAGSGHDLDHLPHAVVRTASRGPHVVVRVGDLALDLAALTGEAVLATGTLDAFLAQGPATWTRVREQVVAALTSPTRRAEVEPLLTPVDEVVPLLPVEVADYVDFYCSLHHATNVGRIFRPDGEALTPAWRRLPIGYHGRAGTVVVSGTDVRRPRGQRPSYGPTERLDLEAELGFVVGVPSAQGEPVPTAAWADHVFGVTLLNDWSARDVQAFEYRPLGPFLGKSFATSVSGWVTPLAALEAARVPLPGQDPPPLPHLAVAEPAGYDIDLEVVLDDEVVSRPPYASTYWSPAQMLAHLTSNGASLRTGDLFASGTVSGPGPDQRGSLLELTWGGTEPLPDGRTWLRDGDTVTLRATAPGALGGRIALGEVTGTVLPAPA